MTDTLAPYLEGFKAQTVSAAWLQSLRQESLQRAETRGFPTTRDEAWKYTSVAGLEKRGFKPSASKVGLDASVLQGLLVAGLDCPRAVFVNGQIGRAHV